MVASPAAFRARIAAISEGSGPREDTALFQRPMNHTAPHTAPSGHVLLTDDDEIDRSANITERFSEAHELGAPTLQGRLGYEQIKIALRSSRPVAWEPKRITWASALAAPARRCPTSWITDSSTIVRTR
jgi:hypothetical protein